MLIAADDALKSAAEAGNNRSERADNKFREAISLLHPTLFLMRSGIYNPMRSDPYIGAILSDLKSDLHARVRLPSVCFSTSQC